MIDAYFDIETTGLSYRYADITVIGIYIVGGSKSRLVQLVDNEVNVNNLFEALEGVNTIYTYNGSRFDLPFVRGLLGVDIWNIANHHDLMHDCWGCNLKGGLKAVEQQLGIQRQIEGINGWDAILLWRRYKEYGDKNALVKLLQYNGEDVMNLKVLREKLAIGMQ